MGNGPVFYDNQVEVESGRLNADRGKRDVGIANARLRDGDWERRKGEVASLPFFSRKARTSPASSFATTVQSSSAVLRDRLGPNLRVSEMQVALELAQ